MAAADGDGDGAGHAHADSTSTSSTSTSVPNYMAEADWYDVYRGLRQETSEMLRREVAAGKVAEGRTAEADAEFEKKVVGEL